MNSEQDLFFSKSNGEKQLFTTAGFERIEHSWSGPYSQLIDTHSGHKAQIRYLRVNSETWETKEFVSQGTVERILSGSEFGTLLRIKYQMKLYTVWIPAASNQFNFDDHQRIQATYGIPVSYHQSKLLPPLQGRENMAVSVLPVMRWEFQPQLRLNLSALQPQNVGVIPYVVIQDTNGQIFKELCSLSDIELRLYRKSDWFFAKSPSDVWNYLINGSLYDPRSRKGVNKRFKCQQCAYAWWSYFDFLHRETEKNMYSLMQDEIAYSILLDMSSTGAWEHGFWSDDMETHARFHLDGLHLLISQYEKTKNPVWLEAAEQGIDFVFKHLTDSLENDTIWFLHDTIEHKKNHRFQSALFGKTPGNSLCINTHVQALTVLYRLKIALPDKKVYAEMFDKGYDALHRVLDYQPGEQLYKLLMFWIIKYRTKNIDSGWDRLKRRLEEPVILIVYWLIRRHYPRLVHPEGFMARDLTLSFASDWYHIINLKDLLILYQQEPIAWLRVYIENGYEFVCKLLDKMDLTQAVARYPHYIEFIDALYLYNKFFEAIQPEEIDAIEQKIYQQTRGYSLDYYTSEFVRDY